MLCSVEHASSSGVVLPVTDHQLRNPADSPASLINGSCQRQCQSIGCSFLSLSKGRRGALHSPPLCSVTGKVLTLLISFFTALCQKNIQQQTLKTSATARHLQPHAASPLMAEPWHFVFLEKGLRKYDRLRERKMIGEHNLKPRQPPHTPPCSLSSLTQRKYCILTGSH